MTERTTYGMFCPTGASGNLTKQVGRAAFWGCTVAFSLMLGTPHIMAQVSTSQGTSTKPTVPFQTYDVISIRPRKAVSGMMDLHSDEATLSASNVSVKMLMMNGYGVRTDLISGLPKWAESTRYDIQAKVTDPNPAFKGRTLSRSEGEAVWHAEMQALLSDGFKLKAHYEDVIGPIYNLVVASGGVKIAVSQAPASQEGLNATNRTLTGVHIPMKTLCTSLAGTVQRDVVDKTGLTDAYDVKLSWTPDNLPAVARDPGVGDPPDIYTALQEQLGLKLVRSSGPIRKLVIDSIEPPTVE